MSERRYAMTKLGYEIQDYAPEATYEPVGESCTTFDCNGRAVADAWVEDLPDPCRYCEDCAEKLERSGDRVVWDESKPADQPAQGVERGELEEAGHRFLECSQAIERSGDEGQMEEYEDAWRDLEAALKSASTQPLLDLAALDALKERLTSNEVVEAAGAAAMEKHDFRPHDEITLTILETARAVAFPDTEGERG